MIWCSQCQISRGEIISRVTVQVGYPPHRIVNASGASVPQWADMSLSIELGPVGAVLAMVSRKR